jgi:dipeptidyl aminopeptidase/acylaminoacyl peptidase
MKKSLFLTLATSFIALSLGANLTITSSAFAQSAKTTPMSIAKISEDFDLSSVKLSPSGKYIAGIARIPGQNPIVRVWDTTDMSKAPKQFGSKTMRFANLSFVKDESLFIQVAQPAKSGVKSDWVFNVIFANLDGSKIVEVTNGTASNTRDTDAVLGYSVYNSLPLDPDNILIQINKFEGTEIVKANLQTGQTQRYARSGENESFEWSDPKGVIRVKSELYSSGGVWYVKYHYRDNNGKWSEMPGLKQSLNDRYTLDVQHVSNDGKTIWVITDKDTDYAVLKKFDVATQTFSETIAANTEYDLSDVGFGSADDEYAQNADPIREICWNGPTAECDSKDETDIELRDMLEAALPNTIVDFRVKQGGNMVLVSSQAPNLPTTYYLLKNKKELIRVGSMREGFDQSNLAPAEWVVYSARDGMKIPGILYTPIGYDKTKDGKLPLVVLPHGGPWSYDTIDFDSSFWPQMFATRGFAVLQPNYRGSEGLGKKLWKSGDKNWGLKMQDDKDDGALWLVKEGIADPNRIMMYGYSYGGFAAAAAAARSGSMSKGIYQCAISGGPAIDLVRISNDWGASRIQRVTQGVTVDGWNPAAHLNEVEIPWLIVHGSYDHQADILHSTDAAAKMKSVNPKADFKFVQIDKMSHTLTEMLPEHKERLVAEILSWTANHCGNISKTFDDKEADSIVKKASK